MPDLLARESPAALRVGADERLARAELRRQVGRLERQLAGLVAEGFGRVVIEHRVDAVAAEPRPLDLGELERLRDELADRIADARATLRERARTEADNRELLRQMIASPADFKWVQVSRDDLGEPGCGHWHSRPRLGPLGMLMGWWRVRVSSGCPLAGRLAAVEQEVEGQASEKGTGAETGCVPVPTAPHRRG
ncbi:MAG TPA: hypothetical protein VFR04_01000 [Solirubrobacterales bacterium]|nr:hypothetical protein [Solirubrobacterales bacterium]